MNLDFGEWDVAGFLAGRWGLRRGREINVGRVGGEGQGTVVLDGFYVCNGGEQ